MRKYELFKRLLRLSRNTILLTWLVIALTLTSISASIWAATMAYKAATVSTALAKQTIRHRSELKAATAKSAKAIKELTKQNATRISAVTARHRGELKAATALSARKIQEVTTRNAAKISAIAEQHRQSLSKAIIRAKARARLQRYIVAVPFLGIAAVGYFEKKDYEEWQSDNPDGAFADYTCLIYEEGKSLAGEMQEDANTALNSGYQYLPAWLPDFVKFEVPNLAEKLPDCSKAQVSATPTE